jgi:hypothetical protein
MNIEAQLANNILMMMAGNFDRWDRESGVQGPDSIVSAAHVTAQGIAKRLSESLRQHSGELNRQVWQKMVTDATREAFIEVDDEGQLVKLGQTPGFADTVAFCTALTVAAAGSPWAKAIEKEKETVLRDYLKSRGIPSRQLKGLMKDCRSLGKANQAEVQCGS